MKKTCILYIITYVLCSLFIMGCQETAKKKLPTAPVVTGAEDSNNLPGFLAGKWVAEGKSGWGIVFDSNGISSVIHSFGRVELKQGEVKTVPMRMNKKSIYEAGKFDVQYDAISQILTVTVELSHFYSEIGDGIIEGSEFDAFVGKVNPNPPEWKATWTSFRKAKSNTPRHPNFDMSSDPNYGESYEIVFHKMTE